MNIPTDKKVLYIAVPAIAATLMAIFYYFGSQVGPAVSSSAHSKVSAGAPLPEKRLYSNSYFKISLEYPASWKPVVEKGGFKGKALYYKGDDGFFGIDALGANAKGPVLIDDAVQQLIAETSNPYGKTPLITTPNTGNVKARLIVPSPDQPAIENGKAALIVEYPKPVAIGNNTFLFFMLYGDTSHLGEIAETLKLVDI